MLNMRSFFSISSLYLWVLSWEAFSSGGSSLHLSKEFLLPRWLVLSIFFLLHFLFFIFTYFALVSSWPNACLHGFKSSIVLNLSIGKFGCFLLVLDPKTSIGIKKVYQVVSRSLLFGIKSFQEQQKAWRVINGVIFFKWVRNPFVFFWFYFVLCANFFFIISSMIVMFSFILIH